MGVESMSEEMKKRNLVQLLSWLSLKGGGICPNPNVELARWRRVTGVGSRRSKATIHKGDSIAHAAHKKASELHEHAARAHHAKGDHHAAHEYATKAQEIHDHSTEAHAKPVAHK